MNIRIIFRPAYARARGWRCRDPARLRGFIHVQVKAERSADGKVYFFRRGELALGPAAQALAASLNHLAPDETISVPINCARELIS